MTDDLDAQLCQRLRGPADGPYDAAIVLQQLRPAMARARRAHRARVGTALTSVLVLFAGGAFALRSLAASTPNQIVVAGPGQDNNAALPAAATDADLGSSGDGGIAEPIVTSATEGVTTIASTSDTTVTGAAAPATTSPGTAAEPTSEAAPTSETVPTSVAPEPAAAPTTVIPTTAAPTQSGTRRIDTECGYVKVAFDLAAETVQLTTSKPKAGVTVKAGNPGPDQVEVSFNGSVEGHGLECEITAVVKDGELQIGDDES